MSEPLQSRQRRLAVSRSAAYAVIVAWGIRAASHILSVVLIALLFGVRHPPAAGLTYASFPLPLDGAGGG